MSASAALAHTTSNTGPCSPSRNRRTTADVVLGVATSDARHVVTTPELPSGVESLDLDTLGRHQVQSRIRAQRKLVESVVAVDEDGVPDAARVQHLGHVVEQVALVRPR